MAATEFLQTAQINRYYFTQYPSTGSSVAAFSTLFNSDWSSVLGGTVQALATTAAPTVAIIVIGPNQVLTVNPGDWVGFNAGAWSVLPNSKMSGVLYTPASV